MVDVPFLLVGLGLGARHATDPDHVAALWNFVTEEQKPWRALRYAISWGLGHATSFTCIGILVLMYEVKPSPWFERGCQALVGLMLLLLGVFRFVSRRGSVPSPAVETPASKSARAGHETFFVGLVHGLAGSAAVALLLLTTQPSQATALAYLFMFGAGSVAGMLLITLTLLLPLSRLAARVDTHARVFSLVPHVLSAGLGVLILVDVFRG